MLPLPDFLVENPERIYYLLKLVCKRLKAIMPFGPMNCRKADQFYYGMRNEQFEKLKFAEEIDGALRGTLIAKYECKYVPNEKPPYLTRFIQGTGVCSHFSFFP